MVWRHWLHRDYLTLEDAQGVRREVECELPEDLRLSLQRLQSNGEGCGGLAITLSAQVARCSRRRFAGTTPDGDPGITAVTVGVQSIIPMGSTALLHDYVSHVTLLVPQPLAPR